MFNTKEKFRILSIDFDFFQNATADDMFYYPDGIDLPTEITEFIWASHYIANGDILYSININKVLYKELCYIIDSQSNSIPVLVTNSHTKIFEFIEMNFNNKQIILSHIDWHHDMMNDNKEIDCGNWVKFLKEKYPDTIVKWITREESTNCYGFTSEEIKTIGVEFDFKSIENTQFDAIFLCRSDSWTPPHLDKYFSNILKKHLKKFKNAYVESDVIIPRNIDKLIGKTNIQ